MHGRRFPISARPLIAALGCALCGATLGCNPFATRLPTPGPLPPPYIEGPSQERFDPYADEDMGPDTFTRPTDFQTGRDDTRTLLQNRRAPAPPAGQGPLDMFPGPAGLYPNVVQ
ncbi:hypothetical protein [Alienimonas californiensis]|uniref:Membrane or secreted protein n=1 Tax=Alienimonas californiensis TaxID=2527989 RepID=A0A517P9S0_9PLAN|nr:hypothetical protein [Alienimonas californiensis]QDT16121.1 hypothetical protein CA12_22190 [Alienimonas californiensis]